MIEIRELVIKAIVQQSGASKPAAGSPKSNNDVGGNEEIIKACVEKIIQILRDKNER